MCHRILWISLLQTWVDITFLFMNISTRCLLIILSYYLPSPLGLKTLLSVFKPTDCPLLSVACECGRRLCDEVTGRCICPPQTVRPACDVCQEQTFSYHPLLGCENCGCSPTGINANAGPQCDHITGQCRLVEEGKQFYGFFWLFLKSYNFPVLSSCMIL